MLRQLGLLSHDAAVEPLIDSNITHAARENNTEPEHTVTTASGSQRSVRTGVEGDFEWEEEMLNGSWLGRSQRTRRGVGQKADGTQRIEWEVTEINDSGSDPEPGAGRGKRKLDDAAAHEEVEMEE